MLSSKRKTNESIFIKSDTEQFERVDVLNFGENRTKLMGFHARRQCVSFFAHHESVSLLTYRSARYLQVTVVKEMKLNLSHILYGKSYLFSDY